MKLVCPYCQNVCGLEVWLDEPVRRQCLTVALRISDQVGSRCDRYLALFRSRSGRALSWDRVKKLLEELDSMVTAGWVQWDKMPARNITPAMWGEAMARVIEPPPRRLPLKNHNYLKRTAYELADEKDRQGEYKRNEQERSHGMVRRKKGDLERVSCGRSNNISQEEMREIREQKGVAQRRKDAENSGTQVDTDDTYTV